MLGDGQSEGHVSTWSDIAANILKSGEEENDKGKGDR